jgi:hypothetical protein
LSNLDKLYSLVKNFRCVQPFEEYLGINNHRNTYFIRKEGEFNYLADNPFIYEYLLFNNKIEWLDDVINPTLMSSIFDVNKQSAFFSTYNEHFLLFEIERKEIPIYKLFLDYQSFYRNLSEPQYFMNNLKEFKDICSGVSHYLTDEEINSFHERLKKYHFSVFPKEKLRYLY